MGAIGKRKIDSYLKYYIGCEIKSDLGIGVLNAVVDGNRVQVGVGYGYNNRALKLHYSDEIKLLLYPLSAMSEDQKYNPQSEIQCFFLDNENKHPIDVEFPTIEQMSHVINSFRKMGYDCDGLIESGLAIDKSPLPATGEEGIKE